MNLSSTATVFEQLGEVASKACESIARLALSFAKYIVLNCPNRKVAHLMIYGRTHRIRKKNFRRALKIIEKEVKIGVYYHKMGPRSGCG